MMVLSYIFIFMFYIIVSIARRLLDPMAEFVKVEPKHLGVGQYQVWIQLNMYSSPPFS